MMVQNFRGAFGPTNCTLEKFPFYILYLLQKILYLIQKVLGVCTLEKFPLYAKVPSVKSHYTFAP